MLVKQMPDSILQFIQDPGNAWIMYGVAAFFFIDGLLLKMVGNKVFTNKIGQLVGGNEQEQQATSGAAKKLIVISAYLTMFFGVVLAVMTFLMVRATS